MAKSNTLTVQEVEKIVDYTVDYFKNWTKSELLSLMNRGVIKKCPMVMMKISNNGYIIGTHLIDQQRNGSWKLSHYLGDYTYTFLSKFSAVSFSIMYQTGRINQALQLLSQDNNVSRLALKSEQFYLRYQQYSKKKDPIKTGIFLTRYLETKYRLKESKNLLEKSLKSAKYIKF